MSLFDGLSRISRIRRLELFNRVMRPTENTKLLDVGGEVDPKGEGQMQLIDTYPWKENVTVANISVEQISTIRKSYPEVKAVVADGCGLPWEDKHFEIVYSNAVIEHVGDLKRQKKMASEIMRVGKRWFVATPNRWFPFEFHMRLPLATWLPFNGYLWIGKIISYNHVQGRYTVGNKCDTLRLMSTRELQECFPGSKIIKQRVTLMAETLIVVGGNVRLEGRIQSNSRAVGSLSESSQ